VGVREGNPAAEPELRDYLNAYFCDLRQGYVDVAERNHDEDFVRHIRSQWSPVIDALIDQKPVKFRRFELPENHSMAPPHGGNPGDLLELGSDDVLREMTHAR
jgi:hypothetical protein